MVHANFFIIFILAAIQVAARPLPGGDGLGPKRTVKGDRPTPYTKRPSHQASHASSSTGQHNEHIELETLIKPPPSFLHLNNGLGMLDASHGAHTTSTVPVQTVHLSQLSLSQSSSSVSTGQTTHVSVHPNPQAHQTSHSPPSVSTGQTTQATVHPSSHPQPIVDSHVHPNLPDRQSPPSHHDSNPSVPGPGHSEPITVVRFFSTLKEHHDASHHDGMGINQKEADDAYYHCTEHECANKGIALVHGQNNMLDHTWKHGVADRAAEVHAVVHADSGVALNTFRKKMY